MRVVDGHVSPTASRLGLRRTWLSADRDRVSNHNRRLWERTKRRNGWVHTIWRDVPGFLKCVREMYEGGYSLTDIGVTFGISRQRMSQIAERELGITGRHALVRYWDNNQNCFRAYNAGELQELLEQVKKETREQRHEQRRIEQGRKRKKRRQDLTKKIRNLAASMDRQPTLWEVARLFYPGIGESQSGTILATYWGRDGLSYAATFDAIFTAAGIKRMKMTGKTGETGQGRMGVSTLRKLTREQASIVRYAEHPYHMGTQFGVSSGVVFCILKGRTYRDVP